MKTHNDFDWFVQSNFYSKLQSWFSRDTPLCTDLLHTIIRYALPTKMKTDISNKNIEYGEGYLVNKEYHGLVKNYQNQPESNILNPYLCYRMFNMGTLCWSIFIIRGARHMAMINLYNEETSGIEPPSVWIAEIGTHSCSSLIENGYAEHRSSPNDWIRPWSQGYIRMKDDGLSWELVDTNKNPIDKKITSIYPSIHFAPPSFYSPFYPPGLLPHSKQDLVKNFFDFENNIIK